MRTSRHLFSSASQSNWWIGSASKNSWQTVKLMHFPGGILSILSYHEMSQNSLTFARIYSVFKIKKKKEQSEKFLGKCFWKRIVLEHPTHITIVFFCAHKVYRCIQGFGLNFCQDRRNFHKIYIHVHVWGKFYFVLNNTFILYLGWQKLCSF